MLFNVSQLLQEPVGSNRSGAVEPEAPLHHGHAELVRVPRGILVRFDGEVFIDAACSRCLVPFSYPEHLEFEEVFAQQADPQTGERFDVEDPDAFRIGLDNTIDITEAVRQYTEVAAEMQPLCRPDCPGICSECGQDLSMARCTCDRTPVDSRWAALAALKRTNG
ncbi:MAG: YceD family protein [Hyphomicrobiales bacterium]